MKQLIDQHVLILGLGASGLAMARWCARAGARVTVADTREAPPQRVTLQAQVPTAQFISGPFDAALMEGRDIRAVFKSPGLAPHDTDLVMQAAQAQGMWVGGELSLFAQALRDMREVRDGEVAYTPKVLAITGTNGKTTVTSLTGKLVERSGKSVAVAGNIGPTLLDTLSQALSRQAYDGRPLPQVWVLELSSFQLDGVQGFEPSMGTVLNISQDHLDWHGNMAAYAQAKSNIFGQQAPLLLNREDPQVMAMLPAEIKIKGKVTRSHVTFGSDMPTRPGDYGIEEVNGMAWLVRALEADETRKKKLDEEVEIHIQRFMPADALRIRGRHNAVNALVALALANAAGCNLAPMLFGLREYRGEPHRVEAVGTVNGIEYFDDSKGTNVGATVAALRGLGADRRLVVILGGDGKGQDFSPLAEPVTRYAKAAVLLGRDAPKIREALAQYPVKLLDASDMQDAVQLATQQAGSGDAVLMSPACASFDMYENYEHRARVFCQAVQQLALDAGVSLEVNA